MNPLSAPLQSFLNLDFGLTLPNQQGDRVAAVETPSLSITIIYRGKGPSLDALAGTEPALSALLIEDVPRPFNTNFDFFPTSGLINPPEETAINLLQGNGWLNSQDTLSHRMQNPAVTCGCPFCKSTLNFQATDLASQTPTVAMAITSLANTFFLHSKPTATKTIYLDFNGHVLPANTAWTNSENGGNAINAPAWSLDSDPAFNDTELARIQAIWQRVAEDFAPFDVNVTTQLLSEDYLTRSSSSDQVYGTRALISPISSYFGNYGGIAYVDVFDYIGDYYKPALVFPENLGNGEKNIAEAITHEVGHNLGLDHDGTPTDGYYSGHGSGATGWAPIMGVGYYQPLSQWSKGEYANANNPEDDLGIITTQNGFSYRIDDAGNTLATASLLSVSNLTINQFGLIERSADQDWFEFSTGTGSINLAINPIAQTYIYNSGNYSLEYLAPPSGSSNLDIWAGIYNTNGQLLFQSNPVDLLTASFSNLFLNAGTYYLAIDGVGKGDLTTGYSDYGSLGQYYITGSIVQSVASPAILVSPASGLTTTEAGGQATFTVVLSKAPTADVTIGVNSNNPNEGTIDKNSLTFTTANWNVAQTVTITGVDDDVDDDNVAYMIFLAPATSSDNQYSGLDATDIAVTNQDNDTAGISVSSPSATNTTEDGGIVTFTVRLNSTPTANVTLPISSSDTSEGTVSVSSLIFTSANWNIPQTVTVTGINDAQSDGNVAYSIVTGATSSTDSKYAGLNPSDIALVNNDNEPVPVTIFSDSFEVSEWNGLWVEDSQNDWFHSTQRARDGSRSAEVDGLANNATLTLAQPLNLTAYGSATLSFSWFIESSWDSGEYIALDFFNGSTWQEQQRLAGNVSPENSWQDVSFNLPSNFIVSNFNLRFRATVSDSAEDGNVDNVKIVALPAGPNSLPQALISGNSSVNEGATLVLSGANSIDSDGSITRYDWDFDGDGQYDDATGASVNFTTPNSGSRTLGLQVTDNRGATATASQLITVNNVAPTANAGNDQTGSVGTPISLSGANSTDPGNDITTYAWDLDGDGQYDDATGMSTNFTRTQPGNYTVGLQVTDADGATSTDSTTVTIQDAPVEYLLFSDSFEVSEWNGNWVEDSQNDWFRSTQRAREGSRSAEVDGLANNASLTMAKSLNLTTYSSATLSFSWFIESSWDSGEYIALDVFNGSSWTEVKRLRGNVDAENVWQDVTLALPLSSNVNLRFRASVSDSAEDGNVDNVRIIGLGSSAALSTNGAAMESLSTELLTPMAPYGLGIGAPGPMIG